MRSILCCGLLLLHQAVFGQNSKVLTIGDKVPAMTFLNVVNYHKSNISLADFKGKAIILDFWFTTCGSCIAAFPKMDSLQQQFGHEFQFLLIDNVLYDSKIRVVKSLQRWEKLHDKKFPFPSVVMDTLANTYFPYRSAPHYVWIDKKGVVKAITESAYVTNNNIQKLVAGQELDLPVKRDIAFDLNKPFFEDGNTAATENILYRSTFYGYVEGVTAIENSVNCDGNCKGLRLINMPKLNLCGFAYPEMDRFRKSQIILQVNDKSQYGHNFDDPQWKYNNSFTLEIIAATDFTGSLYELMREEIKKHLQISGQVEKRKLSCFVLKWKNGKQNPLSSDTTASNIDINLEEGKNRYIHNYKLSYLVSHLNNIQNIPVIDESGITANVTIDNLPENIGDINAIAKALKPYGFWFEKEEREIEVFVLTERGWKENK